ncbi:MAG: ABC transporter permease [Armatimonadetes bacterium]|nr:ABC transporter permease [Armatimonadota bacterium]
MLTLAVFQVDVREGVRLIVESAFGDSFALSRTFVRTTPLLLCSLGVTFAWRAGMYNIGGESQYVAAGIGGAAVAKVCSFAGGPALSALVLVTGPLVGAAAALFAGWLQVRRGVQCVISTILLNFIALQALAWSVRGPLQEAKRQLPQTDALPHAAMLFRPDARTDLHAGVFLALAAWSVVWVVLARTAPGFLMKLVGESPRVARANRYDPDKIKMLAMALSGLLCGMAGAVDYAGLIGQLRDGFAQNWGFLAIPVALIGGLEAPGVLLAALYFGALMAGCEGLARFQSAGTTLVFVIQAVAVLGVVAVTARTRPREASVA